MGIDFLRNSMSNKSLNKQEIAKIQAANHETGVLLKEKLKKLFLFEFYVRHIKYDPLLKDEYKMLNDLNNDVIGFSRRMCNDSRVLDEFDELLYDDEYMVSAILDGIQFGVKRENRFSSEQEKYFNESVVLGFELFKDKYEIRNICNYYRFYDLVRGNDILDMIRWFNCFSDSSYRQKNGLTELFDTVGLTFHNCSYDKGEDLDGFVGLDIGVGDRILNFEGFPFRSPDVIKKVSSHTIFLVDEDFNEKDDLIQGSLGLCVSYESDIKQIDFLLNKFKCKLMLQHTLYKESQEEGLRGLLSDIKNIRSLSSLDDISRISDEWKSHVVISRYPSIIDKLSEFSNTDIDTFCNNLRVEVSSVLMRYMDISMDFESTDSERSLNKIKPILHEFGAIKTNLKGLYCYDLCKSGKKIEDAIYEVVTFFDNEFQEAINHDTTRKYYNKVKDQIKNIFYHL